jgi:NAD(P)-dependent dehydrogenase (short-subunit alcohol dehydrogenase family)
VILPGTIDTPANRRSDPNADVSKWVSPQKLAALTVFLASDDAAEITGAAIPVYGAGL